MQKVPTPMTILVVEHDLIVLIYIHVNTSDLGTAGWTLNRPFLLHYL
jgi:hypothetical protein